MWPTTLKWQEQRLIIIDQTLLPNQYLEIELNTVTEVYDAIKQLKVRGAPAIGVAAAYGLVVASKPYTHLSNSSFVSKLQLLADYLDSSRPTAVNLRWALQRMVNLALNNKRLETADLYALLVKEAETIHQQDQQLCQGIGNHGLPLIKPNMGILTHCNAGALATSGKGTALAPLYQAHQAGIPFKVYADETRPLLQGARLTAWELNRAGIDATLITDNMAAHMMQQGLIQLVIVGTDRVARNGDVANKIGTLGVAIMARHYNIPFYVACPSSTIDFATACGNDIEIEQRASSEVTTLAGTQTAPKDIKVSNPAFDVTPNTLVSGLITERGVITQPLAANLSRLFNDLNLAEME